MKKVIGAFLSILILTILVWFIFTFEFVSWDFRNELWAPSYLLLHGESAYNTTIVFPVSLAVWFPQIIGLFFPLGLLPEYPAANLWLVMNVVLLIYLTWFLIIQVDKNRPKLLLFSLLLTSVFLYPPTFRLLILGQVDIVFIIAAILGTYNLERHNLIQSGFWYAIALTKPQLAAITLPCLIIYLFFIRRDWNAALKIPIVTGFFILVLTIPLWIGNSKWMTDFLSNLSKNHQWIQPSVFSQLYIRMGKLGVGLWFILYVIVLIVSLYLWKKFDSSYALLWSIALTTIASPYIWSWDYTLLLPLFIDTAIRLTNNFARAALFGFYSISLIFSIISLLSRENAADDVLWWFPIVMILGIILSLGLSKLNVKNELHGNN